MFEQTTLNPEQHEAVGHDDRPLLVLAGAGTGKTATVAARVAALIERGVEPERLCLLTFSRRAATEMVSRAGRMSDPARAARVLGGTFHAVAQRLLRHSGHLIGLDPGFSLLDASDGTELIGLCRHDLGLDKGLGPRFPRKETLSAVLSQVANAQVHLSEVVARSFPWCSQDLDGIRAVFAAYTSRKRAQQLCDFDDLLLLVRALGTTDVGRRVLSGLFDYVLVDEYQDVNSLQADFVDLLRPAGRGVTVVGDDAQAIYGFRAATTAAILDFPARYPDAVVVRLERNYRSTPPLLAVANQVMDEAPGGAAKFLWSTRPGLRRPVLRTCADEAAQAEAVCDSVLAHREAGVALHAQAVLFRAGHHADLLELALGRRRIPYVKYGGPRQGPAGAAAAARQPVGRDGLVSRSATVGRHRARHRPPSDGEAGGDPFHRDPG
jgi:DNA helicase-2/ATP-dependent DNA helicase PcrA